MAYKEALTTALGTPQDTLTTTIRKLYSSDTAKHHEQRPDNTIVYNRGFNETLKRVSGALTAVRKHYESWREQQNTAASKRQGANDFAEITQALLDHKPHGHKQSTGDGLETQLDEWMQTRAVQLDRAHQHAIDFHVEKRRVSESNVENRVIYRFEDLETGTHHATSVEPDAVKNVSGKGSTDIEEQRRRLMQFPTEAQAKRYFELNFNRLLQNPGCVEELRLTEKYRSGVLRVTSENTTILGTGREPAKIISRTKQGKVGEVDSESLKLFKSITGLRADQGKKPYSYDSIAMWHTNFEPEAIISTLLYYYHDDYTSNGGKAHKDSIQDAKSFYEAAPGGQSGFNLSSINDTPGSPYDFHRILESKANRANLSRIGEEITHLKPSGRREGQKKRYIQGWLKGNKARNQEKQEIYALLDETRAELADAYDSFLSNVIKPRDRDLAKRGDASPYTFADINTGFKGNIVRRQSPLRDSKKEVVNVPLELRVNDTEGPDRHGAGYRSHVERGPGVGEGQHTKYKQRRLQAGERLKNNGLYQAYQVIQDKLPTLSD